MIRHWTASAAVIDDRGGKVLLVRHVACGLWLLPGGHVEDGESPAEAAVREVHEETGVYALLYSPAGLELPGMAWQPSPFVTAVIPAPANPARPGRPAEGAHEHIDLLFAGVADSTTATTAALGEVSEVRWQPIDQLHELDVRAEVPAVVSEAARLVRLAGLIEGPA